MAGTIEVSDGVRWSAASWLFYWVVGTMAEQVGDNRVADRLHEIESQHLGTLSLDAFTKKEASMLHDIICDLLLSRAEKEWLHFDGRDRALALLRDLIRLTCASDD